MLPHSHMAMYTTKSTVLLILQIEESYEGKNCNIEISSLLIVKASSYTQIKTQIPSLRACSVSHLILELQVHNSI